MKRNVMRPATIAITILMAILNLPAARAGENWPQWRGPNRDGAAVQSLPLLSAVPAEGPPLLWEYALPASDAKWQYYGSPVIAGDRGYLRLTTRPSAPAAKTDVLLCVAMADGRELWRHEQPGGGAQYGAPNTPCVAAGRIYAVGSQAKVICLDAATGQEVWATPLATKGGTFSSSVLLAGDRLVVADGRLIALDATTGAPVWENADIRAEHNSPALWMHQGKAHVIATHVPKAQKGAEAAGKPTTLCLDAQTGTVLWELAAGGAHASPTVSGDLLALLYGDLGLKVYRLAPSGPAEIASVEQLGSGSCTPAIHEGSIYGHFKDGGFRYDTQKRDFLWRNKATGVSSSPIVADGKVIMLVGGATVALGLFDAATGNSLLAPKSRPPSAVRCSSLALSGGRLLVNAGTHLRCYDLAKH